MEQGLYLAHRSICRIAGNLREFHGIAAFREFLYEEREKKDVWAATRKSFRHRKSVWAAIRESVIRVMLYFNQFRKFSPAKILRYSIDEVIVRVTTPTRHAHELLGMQILARTLVCV